MTFDNNSAMNDLRHFIWYSLWLSPLNTWGVVSFYPCDDREASDFSPFDIQAPSVALYVPWIGMTSTGLVLNRTFNTLEHNLSIAY